MKKILAAVLLAGLALIPATGVANAYATTHGYTSHYSHYSRPGGPPSRPNH